jgi:uncharacterized membrane protein
VASHLFGTSVILLFSLLFLCLAGGCKMEIRECYYSAAVYLFIELKQVFVGEALKFVASHLFGTSIALPFSFLVLCFSRRV